MAVNPLDLQTVFSHINQVGKKQALMKENEVLRQDHAGEQIVRNSERDAKEVPATKDLEEGPGKIKDENKEKSNSGNEQNEPEDNENEQKVAQHVEDEQGDEERDKASYLGQHIDIVG